MSLPDPAPLHQLFYVSRVQAQPHELQALIEHARRHNAGCGLTGALLFTGGHFAQVLEGPEATVKGLMGRIGRDRRHDRVRVLLERSRPHRRFGPWRMALLEARGADDLIDQLLTHPHVSDRRAERLLELLFQRLEPASSAA